MTIVHIVHRMSAVRPEDMVFEDDNLIGKDELLKGDDFLHRTFANEEDAAEEVRRLNAREPDEATAIAPIWSYTSMVAEEKLEKERPADTPEQVSEERRSTPPAGTAAGR